MSMPAGVLWRTQAGIDTRILMAKLVDILAIEKERADASQQRRIHLFVDGSFYRAYEWSAWLCCIYIKQFQVTRRFIKSADADMLFVGFPQTSLSRLLPEGCEAKEQGEGYLLIVLPDSLMKGEEDRLKDYANWKNTIPMAEAKEKKSQPTLADRPVSMTGIMKKVMAYNVLEHTPIESMQFIQDIQRQLVEIL